MPEVGRNEYPHARGNHVSYAKPTHANHLYTYHLFTYPR